MKIIVDIAKTDWPHFYPDFFPQVEQIFMVPVRSKYRWEPLPYRAVYGIFSAFLHHFPSFLFLWPITGTFITRMKNVLL